MIEAEHADVLRLARLQWLSETMTGLYAREQSDPGSVDDFAVMALYASVKSWLGLLRLDIPA